MKYYFKSKSKKYLLATILLLSLCPLLGLTYSSFIFSSDNYRASEMYIGSLMYSIKIDENATSIVQAEPGDNDYIIEITNLSTVDSHYKLIYANNSNIEVLYLKDTTSPNGSISNTKTFNIRVINNSSSNTQVSFDVAGGYITNTVEDIIVPSGYTEINGTYTIIKDIYITEITVDGKKQPLPTSENYYLTGYTCNNDAVVSLNRETGELSVKNFKLQETSCTAQLETEPLLVDMPLGSYVSYTGSNGCPTTETTGTGAAASKDACSGKNANQNADTSNYTYGYCYTSDHKFYTYGWRLAYTLDSDSDGTKEAYIVTAGSPECVAGTDSNSTSTIASLNAVAIKYCNEALAYGGTCQSTYTASSANTWAMNGKDYYNITNQWYGEGRRLYSYDTATENSSGTLCYDVSSTKQCGYNSDIIDNGGYYWFGSANSSSSALNWYPGDRKVGRSSRTTTFGARPVVHLKSGIRVKGGSGTMDDPYIIG